MTITNLGRAIVSPQPLVNIITIVIYPTAAKNAGVILKQVYLPLGLLVSLMVGTTFIPLLLLEEKKEEDLTDALVTPVSYGDILADKLFVVLVFQLATTSAVLVILGGF